MARIFDLKKRRDVGTLSQHRGTVAALAFVGSSHLLSGGEDGRIALFRCKDWECLHVLRHKKPVQSLAVHPSGKLALSVGKERSLKLWNLLTGKQAHSSTLPGEPLRIAFSASGKYYAILFETVSATSKIILYSTDTSRALLEYPHKSRLATMAFLRDDYLFAAGEGSSVQILDISASLLAEPPSPRTRSMETGQSPRIKDLALVPIASSSSVNADAILVTASSSGLIKGWTWAWACSPPTPQQELFAHESGIRITCITVTTAP